MTRVRLIIGLSLARPDWAVVQLDVEGAYLQCPREPHGRLSVRIPIQYQNERMRKMKDPVLRMRKKVHGEVDSGDFWGGGFLDQVTSLGWTLMETETGTVVIKEDAILGIYLGDGIMGGVVIAGTIIPYIYSLLY